MVRRRLPSSLPNPPSSDTDKKWVREGRGEAEAAGWDGGVGCRLRRQPEEGGSLQSGVEMPVLPLS